VEQRYIAYEPCGVSLSRYSQEADLKDIRAQIPQYATIHSHILQDVPARLDKTFGNGIWSVAVHPVRMTLANGPHGGAFHVA
jgi:hypothetical protein